MCDAIATNNVQYPAFVSCACALFIDLFGLFSFDLLNCHTPWTQQQTLQQSRGHSGHRVIRTRTMENLLPISDEAVSAMLSRDLFTTRIYHPTRPFTNLPVTDNRRQWYSSAGAPGCCCYCSQSPLCSRGCPYGRLNKYGHLFEECARKESHRIGKRMSRYLIPPQR